MSDLEEKGTETDPVLKRPELWVGPDTPPKGDARYPDQWQERVGAFATVVGKDLDGVTNLLKEYVGEPSDPQALELLSSITDTPEVELMSVLNALNIPPAKLRKNLLILRGPQEQAKLTPYTETVYTASSLLPTPPHDDQGLLELLRAGGVQKVGSTDLLAAVRAMVYDRIGVYDIPKIFTDKMDQYAKSTTGPCPPEYYTILKLVKKREYGDILFPFEVDGRFLSEPRKAEFLQKTKRLWEFLKRTHELFIGWVQSAKESTTLDLTSIVAFAAGQQNSDMALFGSMPRTTLFRDRAMAFHDEVSLVFSGTGQPVARGLAYESTEIRKILADIRVPSAMGYVNHELMLRDLGIAVPADLPNLERNVAQYALALADLDKISPALEMKYLAEMYRVGGDINWDFFTEDRGYKIADAATVPPRQKQTVAPTRY